MYSSLGEEDVALGLVNRVSVVDETKRALHEEMAGHIQTAKEVYSSLLHSSSCETTGKSILFYLFLSSHSFSYK